MAGDGNGRNAREVAELSERTRAAWTARSVEEISAVWQGCEETARWSEAGEGRGAEFIFEQKVTKVTKLRQEALERRMNRQYSETFHRNPAGSNPVR